VNNPLTVVQLSTDAARSATEQLGQVLVPSFGEARTHLAVIDEALDETQAAAERIRRIVDDVRRFARAESHRAGPISPAHVVAQATSLARKTVEMKAQLVVESRAAPLVQASESLLVQVLLNLLMNAAQAMGARRSDEGRVRVQVDTAPDGRARIAVEDNGDGIAPESLPFIFDPFFTTKPVGVGTGLGLSISHGIVTSHGGELKVSSTPGAGTTMTVLLPALPPPEGPHKAGAEAPSGQKPG
jgi:signal transduction histidine kinase